MSTTPVKLTEQQKMDIIATLDEYFTLVVEGKETAKEAVGCICDELQHMLNTLLEGLRYYFEKGNRPSPNVKRFHEIHKQLQPKKLELGDKGKEKEDEQPSESPTAKKTATENDKDYQPGDEDEIDIEELAEQQREEQEEQEQEEEEQPEPEPEPQPKKKAAPKRTTKKRKRKTKPAPKKKKQKASNSNKMTPAACNIDIELDEWKKDEKFGKDSDTADTVAARLQKKAEVLASARCYTICACFAVGCELNTLAEKCDDETALTTYLKERCPHICETYARKLRQLDRELGQYSRFHYLVVPVRKIVNNIGPIRIYLANHPEEADYWKSDPEDPENDKGESSAGSSE